MLWFRITTMVLHFWLIPLLVVVFISLSAFYLVIKFKGGSGVRTEGRTVVHKPGDDEPSG
jgi:hypothetical protein